MNSMLMLRSWSQDNITSWGMCARDHRGIFVATKTLFTVVGLKITRGEALGVHAIQCSG